MEKTLAAIIPTFNRRDKVKDLLLRLKKQKLSSYNIVPIVVVDGSSDGTLEMLQEFAGWPTVVLGNGNWWYTKSMNEGFKTAAHLKAAFILTLNDDVIFDEYYLQTLVSDFELQKQSGIIGSVSYALTEPPRITFGGIKSINGWTLKERNYYAKFTVQKQESLTGIRPSVNLTGRGMLFSTALVQALGGYDEQFVQYGSDTDFSYRAHKAGLPVTISYNARIFEYHLLTSSGTAYNKPRLGEYVKSLFNPFSVNSLSKSARYYLKHGKLIFFPIYTLMLIGGSIYVYLFKYRFK